MGREEVLVPPEVRDTSSRTLQEAPSKTRRPALRYLGGKWKLAPKLVEMFPAHRVYVEPYGGAASVLIRKPRSNGECYNDLAGDVVNLFEVLREPCSAARLCRLIGLTPFAREEYDQAFEPTEDRIERARRIVVRSYMGHGSSAATSERNMGFRASLVNRGGALPAGDWTTLPEALAAIAERFMGVVIESRPALQVVERYDSAETLFYFDPPYLPETRSAKRRGGKAHHSYAHEMTHADHAEMLAVLPALKGMVCLSGYASPLYDKALAGWTRREFGAHADGALDRVEVVWTNRAFEQARQSGTIDLFSLVAPLEGVHDDAQSRSQEAKKPFPDLRTGGGR